MDMPRLERIAKHLSLVIPKHDLVIGDLFDVVRIDRNLSASARSIDHVLRNRVAGGVSPQRSDNFDSLSDIDLEVRPTRDEVHLVKIVRTNSHPEEAVHERLHHIGIIVYALQEHALVSQRHSGKRESFTSGAQLLRGFLWMIHVNAHPDRPVFPEQFAQLRCDSLRQEYRNSRSDANELHVLDCPESRQQVFQFLVGQQKRIPTRQQHVTDFRMRLNIPQALLVLRMEIVILGVRNQPAPRAITTVGRTPIRYQEQHPVGITMHQP
jgi:hypothetical protein